MKVFTFSIYHLGERETYTVVGPMNGKEARLIAILLHRKKYKIPDGFPLTAFFESEAPLDNLIQYNTEAGGWYKYAETTPPDEVTELKNLLN